MAHDSEKSKFIVFKIADYLLALPITDVLKVVNCSVVSRKLTTMGLVQIGNHMIKIVDLHQQFSSHSLPHSPDIPSFLVILRSSQEELYGISIHEPPDLVELPLETIRSFPTSDNHDKPILKMVSHVAVLADEEIKKTIFLLDLKRILKYSNPS